jgi:hypothetical protein
MNYYFLLESVKILTQISQREEFQGHRRNSGNSISILLAVRKLKRHEKRAGAIDAALPEYG